jgi:hypothetical protein
MSRLILAHRAYLAVPAAVLFLLALALSWKEGGDHLWIQAVAMVIALAAFGLAAMAAGRRTGADG